MRKHAFVGLVVLAGMVGLPMATAGQEPPPAGPPQGATELVFEREVFSYPTFERRNPFRALVAGDQGGPRFGQLRLQGIIHSDDVGSSVAIVGTSTVSLNVAGGTASVTEGQAWYLKVGQSIGNTRIVEIRREQVVVEVEEYGLTEQKIMQLQTRPLGGTP